MKVAKTLISALMVLVVGCLFGCGGGNSPHSASQTLSMSKDKSEHTFTFNSGSDGYVAGIKSGSLKFTFANISTITFNSDRVGYMANSTAVTTKSGSSFKLSGLPNNDSGYYMVRMRGGKTYELDPKQWEIVTDKPMFYDFSDSGWMQYGNYEDTAMTIEKTGSTATLTVNFGCDKLVGVNRREMVKPEDVTFAKWVSEGGNVYTGMLTANKDGNLSVTILGMPLNDSGRFYLVLKDGSAVELNYYWNNALYTWYASSQELDVQTGLNGLIAYQDNTTP